MSKHGALWLRCEGAGMAGGDWSANVEFRPLKTGFSVWQRLYDGWSTKPVRFIKVGDAREPLSWRRAVEWLRGPVIDGLSGWQLLQAVEVGGVEEPWARELCAIAWIEHENEFEPLLNALLDLSDADIARCRSFFGPLSDETALARYQDLEESIPAFSVQEIGVPRLIDELEWTSSASWDELIKRAEDLNEIYVLAEESEIACTSLDAVASSAGFDRRPPLNELIAKLDIHSAEVAARRQAENDTQVAEFAAAVSSAGEVWSASQILKCFRIGGSLRSPFAADVLAAWSKLEPKPSGGGEGGDCLTILQWILTGLGEHGLAAFRESRHSEFLEVVAWAVMRELEVDKAVERTRGQRANFMTGPALAIRRRKQEEELMEIRAVADLLRILQANRT